VKFLAKGMIELSIHLYHSCWKPSAFQFKYTWLWLNLNVLILKLMNLVRDSRERHFIEHFGTWNQWPNFKTYGRLIGSFHVYVLQLIHSIVSLVFALMGPTLLVC